MPGRIGCKSIEITLPVKAFRCRSNLTGRIGCKSIEITLPVKPLDARSNLTGQIGDKSIEIMTTKFDQVYNVISIGYHPSDFHPIWGGGQIQSPG